MEPFNYNFYNQEVLTDEVSFSLQKFPKFPNCDSFKQHSFLQKLQKKLVPFIEICLNLRNATIKRLFRDFQNYFRLFSSNRPDSALFGELGDFRHKVDGFPDSNLRPLCSYRNVHIRADWLDWFSVHLRSSGCFCNSCLYDKEICFNIAF